MKFLFVLVLLTAANALTHWDQFKLIHKKSYSSLAEDGIRREIFEANSERITAHNRRFDLGFVSYRMGLNRFADMTKEERSKFLTLRPSTLTKRAAKRSNKISLLGLPAAVDWRTKNAVTPVKDQDQTGDAVAFGPVGAIEGAHAIKTDQLISLSDAQVSDCCKNAQGASCGNANEIYDYVQKTGGIESEADYPSAGGNCKFDASKVAATIRGYVDIKPGSEDDLQAAIANVGPVAAVIVADESLEFYVGGIYVGKDCDPTKMNHGVLIVGYGSDDGTDYYIVKNSWGADWGERGYVRMVRNSSGDNSCIAQATSYPTV